MKKLIFLPIVILCLGAFAQRTTPDDYIKKYAPIAIAEMQRTGVPAAITLAQGILESESGNSDLAQRSNNHFGIKCKNTWQGEKVYHDDDARGECFRKYENVNQSYLDHSDFLKTNSRYAFLFDLDPTDYKAWAKGLKKAGYATNPIYAQKLIDLIEKYNLNQYINSGGSIINPSDVTKVEKEASAEISITPTAEKTNILETKETDFNKFLYVNETKGIKAFAGTSLLLIADKYNLTLDKLLDFNDWDAKKSDILDKDELVFIQRKRKQGAVDFHIVQESETLHQIAQSEGIRLEILLKNNNLTINQMPAVGEKLLLKAKAATTPKLLSKK